MDRPDRYICSRHPGQQAAWRCGQCGSLLCEDCAAFDSRSARIVRCVTCRGVARPIRVAPDRTPYWQMPDRLIRAVLSRQGLLTIAIVAGGRYLLEWIPLLGWVLSAGVFAGYFSLVVRRAAQGHVTLPDATEPDPQEERLLATMFALVFAFVVVWLPLLVYLATREGGLRAALAHPPETLVAPAPILLLLLVPAWLPGALMVAGITRSPFAVLNPLRVVAIVRHIPRSYGLTVVVVALLLAAHVLLVAATAWLREVLPIPVLLPVFSGAVALVVPSLLALVLGRLVWQHAEALGWDDPTGSLVTLVPDATPRGVLAEEGPRRPPPAVFEGRASFADPDESLEDGIPLVPAEEEAPAPQAAPPPAPRRPPRPSPPPRRPAPWPPSHPSDDADEPEWVELGAEED